MNLILNGTPTSVPETASTVDALVAFWLAAEARDGVAVAHNDAIVPRSQWSCTQLAEGDVVEIAAPFAGG
ncbi:MAG: hypothetical protein RLZZ383_2662 [Pseudomonadota bacterium]|jgi:sulfur carrier protein